MWVNYFPQQQALHVGRFWTVKIHKLPMTETWRLYPNECRMMIPGTYAEMHKDYD